MSASAPVCSAIVLAGGEGRRMGGRKDGLEVGGRPMLERALRSAALVTEDIVLLPGRWAHDGLGRPGLRVVADAPGVAGPLGGLLGGLRAARHAACLLLPCDMPFASAEVARRLLACLDARVLAAVVVGPRGREPFHGAWSRAALPVLEDLAARGERSLQAALAALAARGALRELPAALLAGEDPELAFLANVNTAGDLCAARARAGA